MGSEPRSVYIVNAGKPIVLERICGVPSGVRDLRKKFRLGLDLTCSLYARVSGDADSIGRDI